MKTFIQAITRNLLTAYCLLAVSCQLAQAQSPHAIWEDNINGGYNYVRINAITGVKNTIASLPPMTGFVMGDASATNYDLNYYHFIAQTTTNKIFYTLNRTTGAVVYSPVLTTTVVGVEYNCADSNLYGIRVNGNLYHFGTIDPVTATFTPIAAISNMQGYVGGTFSMDLAAQTYTFKVLTSTVFKLRTLDIATGAVVADNTFSDNIRGIKYSPTDNKTYGLWDDNGVHKLEEIDCIAGTHSTVASYTVTQPGFVAESASMNQNGEYTFRGFDFNNNFAIFTIDVTTGTVLHYNTTTDNAVGFEEPICVTGSTGFIEQAEENTLLYPNPANDHFNLMESAEGLVVEVYDNLGRKVRAQKLNGPVSTADLESGTYTIVIVSAGSRSFLKLQVIR